MSTHTETRPERRMAIEDAMTLDELARQYPVGTLIRVKSGSKTRTPVVLGVCFSLPLEAGAADEPALVTRDSLGVGNVYPFEVESIVFPRAVSPDQEQTDG